MGPSPTVEASWTSRTCCDARGEALNLVAHENEPIRAASADLASRDPATVIRLMSQVPALSMPARHTLLPEMDVASPHLRRILETTYDRAPKDFEALLGIEGVGAKTLRALALASELLHGTPASLGDPARFSFAHGGKDGTPFPVDRQTYERTIDILGRAINRSDVDRSEKVKAFKRLAQFAEADSDGGGATGRAPLT
jgi:uncharacterized protein